MNSEDLIFELISATELHLERVKKFSEFDVDILNRRIGDSWSILECCEHLNLYFDYYLPEISSAIQNSKSKPKLEFRPGFLGNYFAKSMLPKRSTKKMNSPKDKNPKGQNLTKSSIQNLIVNLENLIALLEKSKKINLEKEKNSISISKLIKLKLGDTFRFIVNHNERHLQQAELILQEKF